ncbi:Fe-S cluster assembly protein SufD, partial [Sinomicrobium sp. FJxs]|nr:Fe-S cluster assembly protein SufD [Sinomicrobium weinanense]
MELKDKLVSSFFAYEGNGLDVHSPIHDICSDAIKKFDKKGFPTKKEEAWKYTSLNAVLKQNYNLYP